jgi:hypothetical protein
MKNNHCFKIIIKSFLILLFFILFLFHLEQINILQISYLISFLSMKIKLYLVAESKRFIDDLFKKLFLWIFKNC